MDQNPEMMDEKAIDALNASFPITEDEDDLPDNPMMTPAISDVIETRFSRRDVLKGMMAAAAATAIPSAYFTQEAMAEEMVIQQDSFTFKPLPNTIADTHRVSEGYDAKVIMRWGDPVLGDAPEFDPANITPESQAKQFGYNCDFIAYMPLPAGSENSDHGLLCVSHEYTDAKLMHNGKNGELSKDEVKIHQMAHGHSIVEIKKDANGEWQVVPNSKYTRRITVDTPMAITGPAAGDDRLKTSADATGKKCLGTINNCAGGWTPWGTVLIAEENFHQYFMGDMEAHPEPKLLKRYGVGKMRYNWGDHDPRFNINKEPNEANRFGYMVEFDPYDPTDVPVKRTSLGRFKHEGATCALNPDGRVVVYSGDDQRFDYLYKFISTHRYDPNNREANKDLLDNGTLFVARFDKDGTVYWLPLVWGTGPLTPENGFKSQADVIVETRRAADLLGATPMDRPEDVEPNPVTGKVYVMLTNNSKRKPDQVDAANPAGPNKHGHIVELVPPGAPEAPDHAALTCKWNIFLRAGNPETDPETAIYHPDVNKDGWLSCPDNVAFDVQGRMWISTDQGSGQAKNGIPDGMRATTTEGKDRALTTLFFACPRDAEMCGPFFTPDSKTMFVAVQHPGESKASTYEKPTTRWPDFKDNMPPRPSVVIITKKDGGIIGS